MCGLAGWFCPHEPNKRQRLQRARATESLMLSNMQRGTDASGIGVIRPGMGSVILKQPVAARILIRDTRVQKMLRDRNARITLGHTRLGTMGKNSAENAHPFTEGHIIGAHNGIISNYLALAGLHSEKPIRVDSQAAFRLLNSVDTGEAAAASILELVSGSLTLTWVDDRDPGALYMLRHQNPLHLAQTRDTLFWSSEINHLSTTMQAAYGNGWDEIDFDEDHVYRFTWEGKTLFENRASVDFPSPVTSVAAYTGRTDGYWDTDSMKFVSFADYRNKDKDTDKENAPFSGAYSEGSEGECDLCHLDVDPEDKVASWHSDGPGFMLCGECEMWWTFEGREHFTSLEGAIDMSDVRGTYANNLLGIGQKGTDGS